MSQESGINDGLGPVDWEALFDPDTLHGMDEDEIAFAETLADEEVAANASLAAYDAVAIERAEPPVAASDEALKDNASRRDEIGSASSTMVLTRSQAARATPVPPTPPARAEPVAPSPSEPARTESGDAAPPTGPETVEEEEETPVDGQGEAPTMAAAEDLRLEAVSLAGTVYPSPASIRPRGGRRHDASGSRPRGRGWRVRTPPAVGGDVRAMQSFLEETGVIPTGENFVTIAELRAFVRGRNSRSN